VKPSLFNKTQLAWKIVCESFLNKHLEFRNDRFATVDEMAGNLHVRNLDDLIVT
jgi:hypothetical protein